MFISLFSACFWLHSGCCTFFPHTTYWESCCRLCCILSIELTTEFMFRSFSLTLLRFVYQLYLISPEVFVLSRQWESFSMVRAHVQHQLHIAAPIRTCKTILAKWYCGCFSCSLASSSVLPASLRLQCRSHAVRTLFRTNNKQMDDQLFALYAGGIAPRKKRNAIDLVCHCTIPIPILNASQIQSMYRFIAWFTVQNIQHNFPLKMRKKLEISRKQH